jgi:GNAT superfamily N-acetyltransferase
MKIREASPDDAFPIAKVHVDVWRSTYRGIMPDKVLDELTYEQRAKVRREALEKNDPKYRCFVAETEDEGIVGFIIAGPRREGNENYSGEIYAIYLYKEHQGRGIGKALFRRGCEWLLSRGHRTMLLWVLRDNPTRRFYEEMGGKELESKIIEIGAPLDEISYGWDDLTQIVGSPAR